MAGVKLVAAKYLEYEDHPQSVCVSAEFIN